MFMFSAMGEVSYYIAHQNSSLKDVPPYQTSSCDAMWTTKKNRLHYLANLLKSCFIQNSIITADYSLAEPVQQIEVLNWPAFRPDLLPIENIWDIITIWQIPVDQLESYIWRWSIIPLPKHQQMISSEKRRGCWDEVQNELAFFRKRSNVVYVFSWMKEFRRFVNNCILFVFTFLDEGCISSQ